MISMVNTRQVDPTSMDEDGLYPEEFAWTYDNIPVGGIQEDVFLCNGDGPALRHGISKRFNTVLESCCVAGGFLSELIKKMTAGSN